MPPAESRKRLTYLMLFRVGVVTLLLVATFATELAAPADQQPSSRTNTLLGLIAVTYGLTIAFAVWLQRARTTTALAVAQVVADLALTTALVYLTGGVDSGFAFMYLLAIVGASFVLQRSALPATGAAIACYVAILLLRRFELRAALVNAVAFAATGVLSARLAVELQRAGERIESQGARLRDLAALHQDVIRCLTSGLITIGRDRTVITFNAAAGEILGVPPARAIGRLIDELLPALTPLLETLAGDSPLRRAEVVHRSPSQNGEARTLGVSLSPLFDSGGNVLGRIVSFQDLTELRRMELEVARSERLAAVGRLAAGVAHEIRNPLAAISGSIELLAQTTPAEKGDQKELMAIVLREVTRLNALITDLLDFARPRQPERQRLDLQASLAEMLRVFENDRQLDGARVELQANGAVLVDADAAQLKQVVWNLLRNAAEASPAGQPITVEIAAEGSWATLAVQDRGAGIPAEHQARIFEPFFSTKQGGTGLGLATVHRIVEEHQGQVAVSTPPGGGTRFVVRLPLAPT